MLEFLIFVTMCIAIATLIVAVFLNSKNKKTDKKIDSLNYAVGALHYKVDSLQHGESKQSSEEKAQATQTTPAPAPSPAPAQVQTQLPAPMQRPVQPARQTPVQPAAQIPTQATAAHMAMRTPTPAPAQASMAAQQQRVPVQSPLIRQQAPVQAPSQAPQGHPYTHTFSAPKSQTNMEKIIGKNILPFLAAGMVFIGLIFLAILVVPSMTSMQRFIGMFALSGAIFATGFILAYRKKNVFSIALLGTGIGTLFISILMTRIYFNYLGDIPTFALLLVWMIVCMALVKMFNSLTLSITAHVGMVISIIFAFIQGFDQQRALIVVAYQIVATIVIVGGSLLAYRKTYRFGLLASLALTVIATIAIRSQDLAQISTGVIVTSLIIQFVTASVLSFFLATSSAKLGKDARLAFHYPNKIIWIILTILALYPAVFHGLMGDTEVDRLAKVTDAGQSLLVETIPALVCIVVFVIHALVSAILERSIGMPADMVRVSVISTLSAGALMALYQVTTTVHYEGSVPIPFFFAFALIALGISRLLRDRAYTIFAIILLAIEAFVAVTCTYFLSHMPAFVGLIWIAAIMATAVAIYIAWKPAEKRRAFLPILIILILVFFELTLPQEISLATNTTLGWAICLDIVLLILAVLRIINIEALMGMSKGQHVIFAINEYIAALVAVLTVAISGYHATATEQILLWVATALVIVISFVRIFQSRNVSALHPQPIQYLSAIMLTLATQAPLPGLVRLGEGSPFVSSVVAMLLALVLVGIGFALRLKPVRLYGLGLTILAVLKMATYDLSNVSPVGRVIAFIVGGLIAFGISALYNYADKRLNPSRAAGRGTPAPTPAPAPYPAMAQAGVPQGMPQPMTGYVPMQNQPAMGQPGRTQMPTGTPVPMPGQPVAGQAATGHVPMQGQPVTGQPMQGQPTPAKPTPVQQPMAGQPMPAQPAPTQQPANEQPS